MTLAAQIPPTHCRNLPGNLEAPVRTSGYTVLDQQFVCGLDVSKRRGPATGPEGHLIMQLPPGFQYIRRHLRWANQSGRIRADLPSYIMTTRHRPAALSRNAKMCLLAGTFSLHVNIRKAGRGWRRRRMAPAREGSPSLTFYCPGNTKVRIDEAEQPPLMWNSALHRCQLFDAACPPP
jgi:hypothetical protein